MNSDSPQKTILIIEDDKNVRKSFAIYLEDHDYDILEAENGREGIALLNKTSPDLVIVDLRMPEVDGFSVLKFMKENFPDIPVIVASGIGVIEDVVSAVRKGAWDYLIKPVVDLEMLVHAVKKSMERAQLILDNRRYKEHLEEAVKARTEALIHTSEALMESQERLQLAFEAANDALIDVAPQSGEVLLTPRWYSMMGYEEGEYDRDFDTLTLLVHPEDRPILSTVIDQYLKTDDPHAAELRLHHKNGDWVWVLFRGKTVERSQEGESRRIIATATDITDRKNAETALKESEEHYRHLIENFIEGVVIHDRDTAVVYVNKPALKLFQVPSTAVLGKKSDDRVVTFYAENGRPLFLDEYPVNQVLRNRQSVVNQVLKFYRKGSPEPVWTLVNAFPELDRKDQVIQVVVTYFDITIRKNMEEDLRSLEKQIFQAQKLEAIGTLASGVAHDFNNILSSIIGYAELAIDNLPPKNPAAGDLGEVMKAADRATDLVRQILAFSRQQKAADTQVDLSTIVKDAMKMLRASIPSTVDMHICIDSKEMSAQADPTQIYQIIMNLCTNAYHAMEEGMGTLEVVLEAVTPDETLTAYCQGLKPGQHYVRIMVKDNGKGMAPSIRKRIFDPFFTTKSSGQGTGLGLATVRKIVQELRGDLYFESDLGKGTTFYIFIPRIDAHANVGVPKQASVTMGNNEHLLLVDDEKIILGFEETMIRRLNYRVTACSSSVKALELFRSSPRDFDMVVTDMTMPDLTGLTLAREIRAVAPDIPVILTTGLSDGDTTEKMKEYGIDALLKKPFTRNEIAVKIHSVLSKKKPDK